MGVDNAPNGYDALDLSDGKPGNAYQTPYSASAAPRTFEIDSEQLSEHAPIEPARPRVFSGCSPFMLSLIAMTLILSVIASPRPWYTLLFVVLALLPAFPFARFILKNFQDTAVTESFLLSQFLIGAVPLVFIVSVVEWIFSGLIAFVVFRSQIPLLESLMEKSEDGGVASEGDSTEELLTALVKVIPLWKILLFFIIVAFVTAGLVEEVGKWLVARRYRKLDSAEASSVRIGCRGILASACMGALGFAATENMGYVLGIAQANRTGFSFDVVGLVLLRGLLAYPVHIGTQFYIGVSAAQRHVFSDPSSIVLALFVAVLFHGLFDAVAFIFMALVAVNAIPKWIGGLVPVFDVILIGLLLLLCRGRYKALLERERIVLSSDTV